MNINFTPKELEVIALMAPQMTPEQIINTVLRDWFNNNVQRMHKEVKSEVEILDEIITAHSKKVDKVVVK